MRLPSGQWSKIGLEADKKQTKKIMQIEKKKTIFNETTQNGFHNFFDTRSCRKFGSY